MKSKFLLALDIDETLTRRDRTLSEANLQAIDRAKTAGITVAIATGRPPNGAVNIWNAIRPHPHAICFGGAVIHDFSTGNALFCNSIQPELVIQALEFAEKYDLPAHIYSGDHVVCKTLYPRIQKYVTALKLPHIVDPDIASRHWTNIPKVLCFAPIDETKEYIAIARAYFGDSMSVLESSPGFIELNAPNTDKGTGLVHLAESLEIPIENTIAMGDSSLDVPMLRAANIGIAVANANDETRNAASIIAPDCDEDAVAWVIDNVILNRI